MNTKKESGTIISIDHFEEDLGVITRTQKIEVIGILRIFMDEIRKILEKSKERIDKEKLDVSECCSTCAFAPSTDNLPGFPATSYGLLWAIVNYRFFVCHSNQPEWKERLLVREEMKLCSGFQTLNMVSPEAVLELANSTMLDIERVVPRLRRTERRN